MERGPLEGYRSDFTRLTTANMREEEGIRLFVDYIGQNAAYPSKRTRHGVYKHKKGLVMRSGHA